MRRYAIGCATLALWLALTGCATTQFQAQWINPAYAGKPVAGKLLVAGVLKDVTVRRLYEDAMVAQLQARGLQAVAAYTLVPELDAGSAVAIERAARQAGAATILSSTLVARDREIAVFNPPPPYPAFGWGMAYGQYWGWAYATPMTVQTYDIYLVSSVLADAATGEVIWSGQSRSTESTSVEGGIKDFARLLTETLVKAGVL